MEMELRQAGLSWHVAGDDVVILDLEGSVYLKLNGSARLLWERLAAGCSDTELREVLIETYGIGAEQAASDVSEFLSDLDRRGLLA